MSDPRAPVGVFDSGVGGLSLVRRIRALLPGESILYIADNAATPYGPKGVDFIRDRSQAIVERLVKEGAKAIVVACNTATAAAINELRANFGLPIVGMEPAVKPAAAATRSGVIGVLATEGTLGSRRYAELVGRYGQEVRVLERVCHHWVEQVERGILDGVDTRSMVEADVLPLQAVGADVLVLGCTHFPFLESVIREVAAAGTTIIDPAPAVARELERRLTEARLSAPALNNGGLRVQVTGEKAGYAALVARLLRLNELALEKIAI